MDYFKKIEKKPEEDLAWNIPEQKTGLVNIIGGNEQTFRTEIKISEFLTEKFPIKTVKTVLPDVLKNKLPNLENLGFLSSTDSGSFSSEEELNQVFNEADYNVLIGDLSKNAITGKSVASACNSSEKPLLITRDSVDLITENNPERLLMNDNIAIFASLVQLQKLLHAVYYPKIITMSQSLVQVAETMHKFTLSYPVKIITLHNEQILIAENGSVTAVPLEKSGYPAFTVWSGELAGKIVAFNLFNPNNFSNATVSAIFS